MQDGKTKHKNENIEREKLKKYANNLFFKPIIVSIDDMDRF